MVQIRYGYYCAVYRPGSKVALQTPNSVTDLNVALQTSAWCHRPDCCLADTASLPGRGVITNIHITDERLTGTIPQQACLFKNLKELDLDGGNLVGTIPEFLSTCFPDLDELDLSYNQVSHGHTNARM